MFLYIIRWGASNRAISYVFHKVLNFLINSHIKIVNLSTKDDALYLCIVENDKYFFYFQDYLGILNDIYIPVYISFINRVAYQNRKSMLL